MTYLEAVNRVLRLATLMQWDDDDIESFSQNQHASSITLARQAIQHVVNELTADNFLYPEDAQDHLTTVSGTRTYSLASDFVRFQNKDPWFFRLTGAAGTDSTGQFLYEYTGGEDTLQKQVPQYTSQTGTPQWYYFTDDREVGIYPIPDDDGVLYRYDYQKDVMPESESDNLPFDLDSKAYAFVDMAARLFGFLFARQPIDGIQNDVIYSKAKSALMALLRKQDPKGRYGFRYG